jgi:leucyl/phenylalanyl-tRNA--protein transferase
LPVYLLNDSNIFPPVHHAEEGILAVGGDLSPERLIAAYSSGVFPWFSDDEPIIWWAPDPRFVLFPKQLKVSKSMKQLLKQNQFAVTFDTQFNAVIQACANQNRPGQAGTWITKEMLKAYKKLHKMGLSHSVEVWKENKLVGGLYGVSLGKAFFGESMFFNESNASKFGFIHLVEFLMLHHFEFIDCQIETEHLKSLGANFIPRANFMNLLEQALLQPTLQGNWTQLK